MNDQLYSPETERAARQRQLQGKEDGEIITEK